MFNSEQLEKKWAPILEAQDAPEFADATRKSICAVLLENQESALREGREQSSFLSEDTSLAADSVQNWDPVLISLVRRSMPGLIAYDVAGVQPMNGPTGLVFAMKSRYQSGADASPAAQGVNAPEALFDTIDAGFSGNLAGTEQGSGGVSTAAGEGAITQEMGFTIEKLTVEAKTRALKAEYTMELAQDLKKMHGLDAEAELANILSTEILAEINREVIGKINWSAEQGSNQGGIAVDGTFDLDVDADGRWAVEKFKSLLFQIEVESNQIALGTRRGKGNFVICSSNVASALAAAGTLDYSPALSTKLNVDITGNTFAGTLNGRIKVYVDPFAASDYITVGYKGSNSYDAGIYYCPYVPLTMMKSVDPNSFQPKIGFKTRYGMTANPLVSTGGDVGAITAGSNEYFRTFGVTNINTTPGNNTPA